VLSDKGLCDNLIACPEESYRLWCVVVCELETSGWVAAPQKEKIFMKRTCKYNGSCLGIFFQPQGKQLSVWYTHVKIGYIAYYKLLHVKEEVRQLK